MAGTIRALAGEKERGIHLYRAFDDAPAFYSYDALYHLIAGCIDSFRRQGVGRGTRVMLPFDTSIEVVASFLALIGIGALVFSVKPLDARAGQDARSYLDMLCRRYRIAHAVRSANAGVADLPVIELAPDGARAESAVLTPADADDIAFVQFSSGSTSAPKGIPVTRGALEHHLQLLVDHDARQQHDVFVNWLPLYHDLGLILGLMTSIYARNDLHLIGPFQLIRDPIGWLNLLSKTRATHTSTAYFAVNYCLNHLERTAPDTRFDWNFEALRFFLVGSDPTDYDRTMAFQRRLAPYRFRHRALLPAYGMAEAVLVVSATRLEDDPWALVTPDGRKLISTGGLIPGFDVRITREDGSLCAEGELGQIEMRGATTAAGYFEEPTIPFYNADGYFETGDLAYMVRGQLVIAGRAGDRIKVNGQTLFASDFEFAVQSLPIIKNDRVVVFQIEDRTVVLAELSREAIALSGDERRSAVRDAIAFRLGVKLPPEDIHFIASGQFKKTSSGKLKRRAMAQDFLDGKIRYSTRATAIPGARTAGPSVPVSNSNAVLEVS